MKSILIFSFIATLVRAGIVVLLGILVFKHFSTFLSTVLQRFNSKETVTLEEGASINGIIKAIGVLIIIWGFVMALMALMTLTTSLRMPALDFNFKR